MLTETSYSHEIPCTRYDSAGVNNPRLREVLAYASGLCGSPLEAKEIVALHDRKGCLEVLWASVAAFEKYYGVIDRAWDEWGNEGDLVTHYCETVTKTLLRNTQHERLRAS